MQAIMQVVASNALVVVVLAAGVALLGRLWKNPFYLHVLWVLVLLKLVTPPILTVPVALPVTRAAPRLDTCEASPPAVSRSTAELPRAAVFQRKATTTALNRDELRRSSDGTIPATPALDIGSVAAGAQVVPVTASVEISWLAILAWTWAAGTILLACRNIFGIVCFRRLLRSGQVPSMAVLAMAEGIGKRLGLRRVPPIRMLSVRVSPLVWSLGGRPQVFLPAALFERLDVAARETILAHELAHVRRGDHWVRLLEMIVTTLFWWHPVAWLVARHLHELEDQCCDALVVAMSPGGGRGYATALLDTLDFLSERSIVAPLGAMAAKSAVSMARRIEMLQNRTWALRLTFGRTLLLLALAAAPMAVAFGQKGSEPADEKTDEKAPEAATTPQPKQPEVVRRTINRLVEDFPEKTDLSTPESAQAAWNRASGRMDDEAVLELSWLKWGPREMEGMKQRRMRDPKDTEIYAAAQLNAEIVEVTTYRGDFADVTSKLKFPPGVGRDPYSSRSFGRINGVWKNLGEDRVPSIEAARKTFDHKKDNLWRNYVEVRGKILKGETVSVGEDAPKTGFPPMAPGSPLGISVEKADLMGRVEWAMMHGGRDITARKSLEWGEVEKDKDGNRTIRYMFEATIWGKDVMIANMLFTFDAKGNMLKMQHVAGYPKKKVVKPADVTTQNGMKELVEDFFTKNFRDITGRETIEWGQVEKTKDGSSSIRYKYRARIWDRETKIMNQIFTFDAKGNFVSVNHVEGYPKEEEKKPADGDGKRAAAGEKADGPAAAVAEFLEAIRSGNDKAASRMLSTVARQKTASLNRNITPPASNTAKYTVGKVEFVAGNGARVAATWTDLDADGRPKTDEAFWVLRHESDGWRITGVASPIFPDQPPLVLNFEDPEEMNRKQQWVREEMRRREPPSLRDRVERVFEHNFRDVTSRETIEWGSVEKARDGGSSIRYKYVAKIGGSDVKIMNQVFTFDAKGKFVSVKDVGGFPKDM
jgi:beta-lactamase regulating signal transducer with metallopeptidase domain